MEEELKKLQKIINRCKECKFATCEQCEINWTEVQAIQNLLARYTELEEENSKMKANNLLKLNKEINENIQVAYGGKRYNTEGIIIKDYIPKSKVKEKIEQLKFVKNTPVKDNKYTYKECIEYGIEELQELLED